MAFLEKKCYDKREVSTRVFAKQLVEVSNVLKNWVKPQRPEKEELKPRLKAAQEKLAAQQMLLKDKKLPVLVLIEGWGAAGKGSTIGQIIRRIDPRFFKVFSMATPTEEERRKPFLARHFEKIPEAGKFTFLDSG